MIPMKTVFGMLVGAVALAPVLVHSLAAQELKIGFAAEPYPPFTFKGADGSWTGFELELAYAICAEMEQPCAEVPVAWSGIIPALNAGKIDMIFGSMSITAERDRVIDFSKPYYYTSGAFIAAESLDLAGLDDLGGKILGVQGATTHASFARQELQPKGVSVQIYDQQDQANRDLVAGRVDVILADEIAMTAFVESPDAAGYAIKFKAPRHPAFGDGVGVGLREGEPDLHAAVNAAIDTLIGNGGCAALSNKYFGTDICGG